MNFPFPPVTLFSLSCRDPTSSHQVIQTVSCMRINKRKRDQRRSSDTEREAQTQTSLEQRPSKSSDRGRSPILTSSLYVSPTSAVSSVASSVTSTLPTITTASVQSSSSTLISSSAATSSISSPTSATLSSLTSSSVDKLTKKKGHDSANIGSKRFKSSGHKDSFSHRRCEFSNSSKVRVKREHISEKRRHYRHHFQTRRMSSKCTQTSDEKNQRHRTLRLSGSSNTLDATNSDKTVSTKKDSPMNPPVTNASYSHSKSTDASSLNLPNDPDSATSSLIGSENGIAVTEETECENAANLPVASTQIKSKKVPEQQMEEAVNQLAENENEADDHDQIESVRSVLSRYGRGLSTRRLARSEVWNFTLGDDEINTTQVRLLLG